MKTIAYLRVSTARQELQNQKLAILEYAQKHSLKVDEFFEVEISSRKSVKQRRIDELLQMLSRKDMLIVSELSRLGRSVGQIITIVDELVKNKVQLIAIKEKIHIDGKKDMQTKVMITMFSLFAEIERDLISERTKEGLAAAKAKGRLLGRPKGSLNSSVLDGHEQLIKDELKYKVSKSAIARKLQVSRATLVHFMKTRKI
jgi:DNA invertase Pin-like site-specific DNA recombinase